MASSKLLKERIESIQDTRKITNAMYLISSSKLRKARKNYQNVLPYFTRMRDTISRVVPHLPDEPVHQMLECQCHRCALACGGGGVEQVVRVVPRLGHI